MARTGSTGVLQLHEVSAIASTAAPTLVEVQGGTEYTSFLRRDGLDTPQSGSTIDIADASSLFNKTARGSYGGDQITATFYRDDTTDDAWDGLTEGTVTHLVVARFGGSGALGVLAVGDLVDVYQVEVVSRSPVAIADNEAQRFVATFAVTDDPDFQVALA